MIFIFGLGKITKRNYGSLHDKKCKFCQENNEYELLRTITWFTLFFIPIIPYRFMYYLVCPNCEHGYEITRDQFDSIRETGLGSNIHQKDRISTPADDPYAGKNEVQRNFLMSMEKARKQKENS